MSIPIRARACLQTAAWFVLAAIGIPSVVVPQEPPRVVSPRTGVLLLRNGSLLEGAITRVGDRYVVAWGDNDQVRVPVEQVEQECRTRADVFQYRFSRIRVDRSRDCLDLADWCLRQRMYDRAAELLLHSMQLDPAHPGNAHFETRLRLAVRNERAPVTAPTTDIAATASIDPDEELAELPPGTVEQFTAAVQPLLLNRCSNANCHGSATPSQFQLVRPTWSRTLPRRFTHRNLLATLELIDASDPSNSPLLVMPRTAHGASAQPVFEGEDDEHYQRLQRWVHQAVRYETADIPEVLADRDPILSQAGESVPGSAPQGAGSGHETGGFELPTSDENDSSMPEADPFDPEIFNRRYGTSETRNVTDDTSGGE